MLSRDTKIDTWTRGLPQQTPEIRGIGLVAWQRTRLTGGLEERGTPGKLSRETP